MSRKPFFSIIMASTLAEYKGAATDRTNKLVRAIESVIAQSFGSWELIVVADGCRETFEIIKDKYLKDERIDCILIEKHGGYGGQARNVGHRNANGIFVVYLDNDDVLGTEHLEKIERGIVWGSVMQGGDIIFPNVVLFDDLLSQPDRSAEPIRRKCRLQRGKCGTSNIAFQASLPVSWEDQTYLHDWVFIKSLMKHGIKEIPPAEYIVCHIPYPQKPLDA